MRQEQIGGIRKIRGIRVPYERGAQPESVGLGLLNVA